MDGEKKIYLQDKDLVASSKTRNCYLHPSDPEKVIKIVRKKDPFRKKDANLKEWAHYQRLKKEHQQFDLISTYHGFVETNLGQGLLIDCIRDYDGHISKRLDYVMKNQADYDIPKMERALDELCQKIIEKNIQLFDLNWFNILVQISADGKYRPICIDVKGPYNNYELIPVSNYIPFFSRMKLKRRCMSLMQKVHQLSHN